ncbi:MAG: phosphotransferase [Halioglobus sp.]
MLGLARASLVLEPVAGDASSRRYYRARTDANHFLLVDAPPATEKNTEFVSVQALLANSGVRVPRIIAADIASGHMLLEDLGDELLLPALRTDNVDSFYRSAFDVLLRFSRIGLEALPCYDEALLKEELGRFTQWFVTALLQHSLTAAEREMLDKLDALLIASALAQPRVFVHRDFHSRNLMLTDGDLAVIDFQDAVAGPITYDLVSLLRDCYVRWPAARVSEWALNYRELLLEQTGWSLPGEREFLHWFDLMGLQRHIKVLGTFARLYLRDGKQAYLQDLPLVIHYVQSVLAGNAAEHAVCAEVSEWFDAVLLPRIRQQDWSAAQ